MIGLLKKDLYTICSSLRIYFIIPLIFAGMGYMNKDLSLTAFAVSFLPLFIVVSSCAYDEMANFSTYALTLPISRKDLVISKFAMSNIFILMFYIGINLLTYSMFLLFGEAQFPGYELIDFLLTTFLAAMICNILIALFLVVIFKFGTEKGRVVYMITFIIIFAAGGLLNMAGIEFTDLLSVDKYYLTVIITAAGILVEAIAIALSEKIVRKQEL